MRKEERDTPGTWCEWVAENTTETTIRLAQDWTSQKNLIVKHQGNGNMSIPCVVLISIFNGYETAFGWLEQTAKCDAGNNQGDADQPSRI